MTRRGETLELAVLGLLRESPMHGYELRKQLSGVLGWGRVLSYGSLYPALKRMLRAGWIVDRGGASDPAPSTSGTKPAGRRQRIVYELTPAGVQRFAALMADAGPAAWEDDIFDVRFAFFGRTETATRLRILEGRRTRLEERLAGAQSNLARPRRQLDTYVRELQRHGAESVERELHWLTALIEDERRNGDPGAGRAGPVAEGSVAPDL